MRGKESQSYRLVQTREANKSFHSSQHECCASRPDVTDQGICIREHLQAAICRELPYTLTCHRDPGVSVSCPKAECARQTAVVTSRT